MPVLMVHKRAYPIRLARIGQCGRTGAVEIPVEIPAASSHFSVLMT
jgi:hypothetical protein